MIQKGFFSLLVLLSSFLMTACDEHEPVDNDIHPGYILCSDGRVVSDLELNFGEHTPVAVVFAPRTDEHPVLAVLLDEVYSIACADTLNFDQKTSGSLTEYDGYTNTVALQASRIARDSLVVKDYKMDARNFYTSPLGLCAFSSHWFCQSDYIPCVRELGLLYMSLDRVNPVIERCGGTPLSRTADNIGCWYWSSTEVSENKNNQAWLFSMADGSRHKAPKTNHYRARLIVEYNPLNFN